MFGTASRAYILPVYLVINNILSPLRLLDRYRYHLIGNNKS